MEEIDCLACGKNVKIPNFIDSDNYDGQVVCQECQSLLHVRLLKGKVQKYKIVENKYKDPNEFNWTKTAMQIQAKKGKENKETKK
jgi:DNA-directed RNA polymerase subunit RPC12/RpoP